MRLHTIRILLLASLLAFIAADAVALVGDAQPVTGVHPAVLIVGSRGNSCTGVAIATDLVLTAAHCVPAGAEYKLVQFDSQRRAHLRDSKRVVRHPNFDQNAFQSNRATADVALIKFGFTVLQSAHAVVHAQPIGIAPGDRLEVAGYGVTRPDDGRSGGTLRSSQLVVTGRPGNLQIRLMDPNSRNERAGVGACTGDSGAPVFAQVQGRWRLVGLVSWSTGPGNREGCGGLTGVTPLTLYYNWIADTARRLGSSLAR